MLNLFLTFLWVGLLLLVLLKKYPKKYTKQIRCINFIGFISMVSPSILEDKYTTHPATTTIKIGYNNYYAITNFMYRLDVLTGRALTIYRYRNPLSPLVSTMRVHHRAFNFGVTESRYNKVKIYNYVPYSLPVLRNYASRVYQYSHQYMREAKIRGVEVNNPLKIYSFGIRDIAETWDKHTAGACYSRGNRIFLKNNFTESTFYHELGHCEFNYSHSPDINLVKKGHSTKIMTWYMNEHYYRYNRKALLDEFFKKSNHSHLKGLLGTLRHRIMLGQVKLMKDKFNKKKKKSNKQIIKR